MRKVSVLYNKEEAGFLTEHNNGTYTFEYTDLWLAEENKPAISLTLPKRKRKHRAKFMLPFFYNLLPEGTNKKIVCRNYKIDEDDYFGILIATAKHDTIGVITICEVE